MNTTPPKRDVIKLPPAPGTKTVEVVTCQEEKTCNLQMMFDSGFRISMPLLNGDTKDTLKNRLVGLISQYRPYSGDVYGKIVYLITKSLSESLCGADGKIELIGMQVAVLIPRWEVNLFWDFLADLKVPVTYEEALEVMTEMGIRAPLAESTLSPQSEEQPASPPSSPDLPLHPDTALSGTGT